jgi:hypothetical protein
MNPGTIVFSYRPAGSSSSVFMKLSDVEKETSLNKVLFIYEGFNRNLFSLEKGHLETIKKIESRLKQKAISLNQNHGSILWRMFITIVTLGTYWIGITKNDWAIKTLESNFSYQIKKLEAREAPKQEAPLQEVIRGLKAKQLVGVNAELDRLNKDPFIKAKLDEVSLYYGAKMAPAQLVVYGHSLELQKELSKTHFVLNHGLNYPLVCLNALATRLTHKFSKLSSQDAHVLRHESLFRFADKSKYTPQWFEANMDRYIRGDENFRTELICCDINLQNKATYESALDFYLVNKNIALWWSGNRWIRGLIQDLIKDYLPEEANQEKVKAITNEILKVFAENEFEQTGFGLYSICIPKERFSQVAYISKAFGFRHDFKYSQDDLSLIQDGGWNLGDIQARVVADKLDLSKGDYIVAHSLHESIETEIQTLIDQIIDKHLYSLA